MRVRWRVGARTRGRRLGAGVATGHTAGYTDAGYAAMDFDGWGTGYVLGLSVLSEAITLLALGLVRPWGEVLPRWVPLLGGRPLPRLAVVVPGRLRGPGADGSVDAARCLVGAGGGPRLRLLRRNNRRAGCALLRRNSAHPALCGGYFSALIRLDSSILKSTSSSVSLRRDETSSSSMIMLARV